MSFDARVFRILIASPSDVADERDKAVQVIQAWNDQHAAERQVVLLPLRWETHSAPEYGRRPQETINRQVVDHADLLVGIFWSRLGSPTGVADSGTVEEIERSAKAGKPVMLYFSKNKEDPDKLDLEQLVKLRDFKKKTFPNALVESFADPVDFLEKFRRQLDIQVRTIIADQDGGPGNRELRAVTDILLELAIDGVSVGNEASINAFYVDIANPSDIPDYSGSDKSPTSKARVAGEHGINTTTGLLTSALGGVNKDFYRQSASYMAARSFFRPLSFSLKNVGAIGARDVYIEISIFVEEPDKEVVLMSDSSVPKNNPSRFGAGGSSIFSSLSNYPPVTEIAANGSSVWNIQLEIPALQPQRKVFPHHDYWIGARESCTVIIQAQIFADTLSEPIAEKLTIHLDVKSAKIDAEDIVSLIAGSESDEAAE